MKYGGVTLSKFSLAGFEVTVARPEVLLLAIWLAYAYFLYRYYQYFSDEGVSRLKKVFFEALEKKCHPLIKNIVESSYPHANKAITYSFSMLSQRKWVYHGQDLTPNEHGHVTQMNEFAISIPPSRIKRGVAAAALDTVFRNSVVTDYLLPFGLAMFVLWYCGYPDWSGSFLRFIFP
jgi:hypothetical protein